MAVWRILTRFESWIMSKSSSKRWDIVDNTYHGHVQNKNYIIIKTSQGKTLRTLCELFILDKAPFISFLNSDTFLSKTLALASKRRSDTIKRYNLKQRSKYIFFHFNCAYLLFISSARIGGLLEQLQRLYTGCQEAKSEQDKPDLEQFRYVTNKIQQLLTSQGKILKPA